MNIINKRKSKNLISQSDINIISPLGQLESHKILYFQKVNSVNHINTLGAQPIIVYKKSIKSKNPNKKDLNKTTNKNSRYEKINKSESETKVITDGNIEKKVQKFNSFSNTQKNFNNNKKIIKTKSFQKNIILIEKDKRIKEEFERKKNINEQKLFSKTVRDSNMRPVFPKNKNKQMSTTKKGFDNKNKNEQKENIENEDNSAKKNLMMNQLVQNAVVIEMKKYQNDMNNNKKDLKLIKNNKKREYLAENGITTSTEELTINDENSKIINDNNVDLDLKNQKRISDTSNQTKINNYLFHEDMKYNNIPPNSPKMKNKPEIEQFEYIIKINEEKKKLISEMRKTCKQDKYKNIIQKNNYISPKAYPSFRTKNKLLYDEETKTSNDTLEHSYFLKDRKNHRTTEEIHQYLKEKKLKYKQNEENKQLEKNKKLFVRFKNLYNLNMKDNNNTNKEILSDNININYKKNKKIKVEERKDEYIEPEEENINEFLDKNNLVSSNYDKQNNIRRKKEVNDYYIGSDSTMRNNSTLVDINEYYLNILESQQLLVNSQLKKIEDGNEINENTENINDENNLNSNMIENNEINNPRNNLQLDDNELNTMSITKDQIKKLTEKEITKTSNSKKVTEEILNTSSIEELKLKINTTLKRANIFLSKQNKSNNNISENTTSNNQNYINSNTNTNNNTNIINIQEQNKEEENIRKENEINDKIQENKNEDSKDNMDIIDEKESEKNNDLDNIDDKLNNKDYKDRVDNQEEEKNNKEYDESNDNIEEEKNNLTNSEISNIEQKQIEQKRPIDSRVLLNLMEIIKFIFQRKTFVILYESYINHAINQQYKIAFSFFVAICKQYPFKKIEEFYNYKTYNYAFRQLLRPFNRYNFKYFVNCFNMRKKVEYLNVLLTKMIKFKTFERIYIYGQYVQEDEEEKAFKMIIMKIMNTLIRPHIYEVFYTLMNTLAQNNENNEEDYLNSNLSDDNDKREEEEEKEREEKAENEVNFNISDDDDNILTEKSFNNNNNKLDEININNEEIDKEEKKFNLENILNSNSDDKKEEQEPEQTTENKNDENKNENINENINISEDEEDNSDDINNQRRKNDSSLKMNSFLYESLDSSQKSSLNIEPNSLDNDKLHKLKLILLEKNKNFENGLNDNYNIDDIYMGNSSKKSDKSLQELIKIGKNGSKTLSDMMEENSYQKSPENKNEFNELKKTLRSQISEGKIEKIKDEGTKVVNETKDTKEITDDSNTINLNTNNKSDIDKNKLGTDTNSNSDIKKNNNIQNIKINNIQKKIDYEEEEKNEIKIILEENKEIIEKIVIDDEKERDTEIPKKNMKLLKNYKIIEKPEKLEHLITDEEKPKSEEEMVSVPEVKKIKIPLIKIINDSNDSSTENKNSKEEIKTKNKFSQIFDNPSSFTETLVNEIVNNIILSEIKSSKIKLLPNKKYKFEKFIKKSTNMNNNNSSQSNNSLANSCNSAGNIRDSHHSRSSLSQISLHEDLFSLNDSLNSNYSVYSVFNKTIKDKKKEHSLHLYFNKICPKLISYLHSEIIKKYPKIYENISTEKKNNSEKLMISLVLQDAQMLRNNYRRITCKESLEQILDKKEILKNFAKLNKKIRQDDNITTDNYYDNMLNECVLETALELIEKERYYGETGNPLKWSNRIRDIKFKYEKTDAKKFADFICKNILKIIHNRIGLINDNYSYLSQDEINYEREKRLLTTIKGDLNRSEYQWKNLEMEETQLKVESTEIILDQLYNEVIEILEHIQYNRISPELYQNKSIYACEEIPKLSFQQTTTEDVGMPEGEENDMLNI